MSFESIIANNIELELIDGDYIANNGLVHCGKCGTAKQVAINWKGRQLLKNCICHCQAAEERGEIYRQHKRQEQIEVSNLNTNTINDTSIKEFTFSNDDGQTKEMRSAKMYCQHFEDVIKEGRGQIWQGQPGNGKTFIAGCIANRLREEGYSVLFTSMVKLINDLSELNCNNNLYIKNVLKYDLVVLDDFGVTRTTEFIKEKVFFVIDELYKNKIPLIVTTNIDIVTSCSTTDEAQLRIYDRLLERNTIIEVKGASRRRKVG